MDLNINDITPEVYAVKMVIEMNWANALRDDTIAAWSVCFWQFSYIVELIHKYPPAYPGCNALAIDLVFLAEVADRHIKRLEKPKLSVVH